MLDAVAVATDAAARTAAAKAAVNRLEHRVHRHVRCGRMASQTVRRVICFGRHCQRRQIQQ